MNEESNAQEPEEEPSQAEVAKRLLTPEGRAFMAEIMRKTLAGDYGELTEEVMQSAKAGLERVRSQEVMEEVMTRVEALRERLLAAQREKPECSMWAFMRDINEEMKELMDLALDVHEPRRSEIMPCLLSFQQHIEEFMKKL
ncbi:MAG TPA: hypothetical protein DIT13_19450 [Verrucomicrobiales bacterium]|nr:hypothetical protein [Verrucomicrobiales bacterium]HRJ10999.1 hypothetical protein [Prosthecobacter sp.]HRK16912.1 hypothetical protein [Prosthecobacter sp.]